MRFLVSLLALATLAAAAEQNEETENCCGRHKRLQKEHSMDYQYLRYVAHFNKDYRSLDEYAHRREHFEETEKILIELSHELDTQTVGHNKFSDWTIDEIEHVMGLRAAAIDVERMRHRYAKFETDFVDAEIDWVERGAVTPVRDQGYCGSSWAHATAYAIEGAHFINSEELIELSTQQLVDCDSTNYGCEGGFVSNALEYAEEHAIMTEADYPQAGHTDEMCHFVEGQGAAKVTRFINVVPNNPEQLKIAVSMGPVAVSIAASEPLFLFYRHGVITSPDCGDLVNSAATIVGYGHEEIGQEEDEKLVREFWIIKNSWGRSWGEHGYGRIAITDGRGTCGINTQPTIVFTD